MERFRVKRPDHSDLEFDGEMLVRVNTPRHVTSDGERGYELTVYCKADGGYVASVEYLTTFATERTVHYAEVVDQAKDVENFFFVLEPCEFLGEQLLQSMPEEQRLRLRKELCKVYDGHLDTVLKAVQAHAKDHPCEPADAGHPVKNGLLSFLGLD